MAGDEIRHLRVLIANERRERLELLAQVVAGLGHEVIAREIDVKEVGAVTARERPDVALVGLGLHSEHALELISEIVREASCPVIALLSARHASAPGPTARSAGPCGGPEPGSGDPPRVAAIEEETVMALGDEIDKVFRREVKSLPAYEKAQAASGSGIAPPVDEMNQLLMGLVVATQRSFHLLAERIEDGENA